MGGESRQRCSSSHQSSTSPPFSAAAELVELDGCCPLGRGVPRQAATQRFLDSEK